MRADRSLYNYIELMRLNKPIGILLLFWPTLWALWLASGGKPSFSILLIFTLGVILMRSAGCIINDILDRHFDPHVARTCQRPLATGKVSVKSAFILASGLIFCAFVLVLFCNFLTISLAFLGLAFTLFYPLMKRFTHLPQVGLGVAFSWGVVMAFAAETREISLSAGAVFLTSMIWPVIYDTMYAMADRIDDKKIGIKSTAILFNAMDKMIIALLQLLFIIFLIVVGLLFHLHLIYYQMLCLVFILFIYQQWLISDRDPKKCFKAFLNNHWVGLFIFFGIFLSYRQ